MASSETSIAPEPVPILRMEGLSLLTSSDGTATLNADPATTQFIAFPVLPDVSISGIDQQNLIFARSIDGNTILLDASQLAYDQAIPIYEGSSLFQVASEVPVETTTPNKTASTAPSSETSEIVQQEKSPRKQVYEETVYVETVSDELSQEECVQVVHEEPVYEQLVERLVQEQVHEINAVNPTQVAPNDEEILPPDRGPHKCSVCGQQFNQMKLLQRHWRLHAEDKPHRCEECDASFNKPSNLILHKATHCTSDPACPVCKRKFSRMASLKAHLMLHEVEDNLTCGECGDEFNTQFKLDKHIQEHMSESAMNKTFICRTCSKGFKKLSHLREHSKMHYKIKASLHRKTYKKNIDRSSFSHKCYFCGKLFQKPSQLIRHNRIHTGERPFQCSTCGKAFNQKGALLIHSVKHTGERPHVCEFCQASFAQKGNLRNHIRRVHTLLAMVGSAGVHKCELCSCVFRKLGSLNAHMSRAHAPVPVGSQNNGSYSEENTLMPTVITSAPESKMAVPEGNRQEQTNTNALHVIDELIAMSKQMENDKINQENLKKIASESSVNADILQQALENSGLAPSDKPYVMTIADSATGTLKTHIMRNIGGVRWYQCVYCVKEFKKPSDLVRHIRIHTHEKPYKCDQCFRAFAVKSTLNAHVRTHSGTKEFSCEHCKKLFSTSGSLKVHLLLHTGVKPFTCNYCHKAFRTVGHRNSHMQSHDKISKKGKKTFKSPNVSDINYSGISLQEPILITDTGYMQQTSKNSYQLVIDTAYSSARPYRCSVCEKGFKKSSHLKQHLRSHTGEKPYECTVCLRKFVSNGVLKSHLKTHTGVKAFSCEICDASFTTNGSLKRHMCIHRDDRPYMCPYCQKTFKTSMNCKKHMKTHRYELALGLASNVAVTVISEGAAPASESANQKDVQNPPEVIENVDAPIVENIEVQPVISFGADSDPGLAETETVNSVPHHLQEVFNAETGMIETAEIIPRAPFDPAQGSIFTLEGSEFVQNNLTLQLEHNEDNIQVLHDSSPENDPLVSSVSNMNAQSKAISENTKVIQNDCDNVEKKDSSKRKRAKKPYKCLQCSKVFKRSTYLKQHTLQHTGERPFRCSTCGNFYTSKRILQEHMQTHNRHANYKCKECNSEPNSKVFSTKKSLIRHMAIHDTKQPFHCSYCCARFRTRELYKEHLNLYHNDKAPQTTGNDDRERGVISYVSQSEPVTEQIITDVAKKSVTESPTDKQGKSEYLPKHPHVCPHCPKSFKKPSDLVRHIRIHTGEKPYCCQACGKTFTVKSTLDSHIKTHTGERNFICHVCGSLFATKGSLKVHLRLHTGAKPFKCPYCELTFRTSGHRKSHMLSHFKDKDKSHHRTRKKVLMDTENVPADNLSELPSSNIPGEVINIQTEPCPEIQVPVAHEDIQLQLPATLVGQNIQITTVDPSFLTKPIQIDAALLQQLQQNFNISITLTPAVSEQINKIVDVNQTQPILNLEANHSTIPVSGGTYTVNPMIIQHLGYTIPQQSETQVTDSVPLLNLTKNSTTEIFQNSEILDSQVLTLDTSIGTEVILDSNNKNTTELPHSENVSNNIPSEEKSPMQEPFTCSFCLKSFKTAGQFNAHQAIHKTTAKYIYRCEMCNRNFKKKNHFLKHMQIHSN